MSAELPDVQHEQQIQHQHLTVTLCQSGTDEQETEAEELQTVRGLSIVTSYEHKNVKHFGDVYCSRV